jgi:hypothetical protein
MRRRFVIFCRAFKSDSEIAANLRATSCACTGRLWIDGDLETKSGTLEYKIGM